MKKEYIEFPAIKEKHLEVSNLEITFKDKISGEVEIMQIKIEGHRETTLSCTPSLNCIRLGVEITASSIKKRL